MNNNDQPDTALYSVGKLLRPAIQTHFQINYSLHCIGTPWWYCLPCRRMYAGCMYACMYAGECNTVTSQKDGSWVQFLVLCGVCMFFQCLHGLFFLVLQLCPKHVHVRFSFASQHWYWYMVSSKLKLHYRGSLSWIIYSTDKLKRQIISVHFSHLDIGQDIHLDQHQCIHRKLHEIINITECELDMLTFIG